MLKPVVVKVKFWTFRSLTGLTVIPMTEGL